MEPSNLDLFQARMLVGIADWVQYRNILTTEQGEWSRAKMALGGRRDLDNAALAHLADGTQVKNVGRLLQAFWAHYRGELELYRAESRLLINPPADIQPNADLAMTFITQEHLNGSYGEQYVGVPFGLTTPAQLEDVAIFWGHGLTPNRELLSRIRPGSTITLAMPSEAHRFWMSWAEVDLELDPLIQAIRKEWKLDQVVHRAMGPNVTVEVLGVE